MNTRASYVLALLLLAAAVVQASDHGEPGKWPQGDVMNGDWVPSRSTHYGWTNGGACGQGVAANCWPGRMDGDCDKVPEALKTPIGGLYAAPEGGYYVQAPGNYVSCGECFEIRCDDPNCPRDRTITVFISDACPCIGNEKWCCNKPSLCQEMSTYPSLEGPPHCPVLGGPWDTARSIHLDLSNYAFALLERGDRMLSPNQGFLNTFIRRVTCPVYNNSIWLSFAAAAPLVSSSCVLGGGGTIRAPCFYFLLFGLVGVGGPGAVARVQYVGRYSFNGVVHDGPFEMELVDRDQDPQGRYGAWSVPQNYAMALPFRLRFWSRTGEMAESVDMTPEMFAKLQPGAYVDTHAQFGWAPPPTAPPPPQPASTGPAPQPVSSTGPPIDCWTQATDQGTNEYWFAFQVNNSTAHQIASVSVVGNGQTIKLSGPNNWGPTTPTVYTGKPADSFPVPYLLHVVDAAGNANNLLVNHLSQFNATYTC